MSVDVLKNAISHFDVTQAEMRNGEIKPGACKTRLYQYGALKGVDSHSGFSCSQCGGAEQVVILGVVCECRFLGCHDSQGFIGFALVEKRLRLDAQFARITHSM